MEYAQNGGVPTRQDVYESDLSEYEEYRYMKPTAQSTPYVHSGVDYPFAPDLLEITEQRLEEIAAGLLQPKEGLDTIASEIDEVVKDAEYIS